MSDPITDQSQGPADISGALAASQPPSDLSGALAKISGSGTSALQGFQDDSAKLDSVTDDMTKIPAFDAQKEMAQQPQINRSGVMATMPYALALSTLAGAVAGIHPQVMLSAMDGMTKGLIQGNQQAYQDEKARYDDAYQKYSDRYKEQFALYKQMQSVYKGDVNADLKALDIALKATGYQGKVDEQTLRAWQWQQMYATKLQETQETVRSHQANEALSAERNQISAGRAASASIPKVAPVNPKVAIERKASADQITGEIDSLIQQINATPGSTGLAGYVRRAGETAGSAVGVLDENQVPAHQIQTAVNALLLKLPKVLTGTSKSAKDERARIDQIANALRIGATGPIAVGQLKELKKLVQQAGGDGGEAPQKTIVRTGTDKATGKKVVQYSDGTTAYLDASAQ